MWSSFQTLRFIPTLMIEFLHAYDFEIAASLISFIYIYLSIKASIYLWPIGLISSLLYIYVYYEAQFYADMGLQFYYAGISIYGWFYWKKNEQKNAESSELRIHKIQRATTLKLVFITILLFAIIAFILTNFTDSPIPFWDALTTAISITATWMLAKKIIENWIFWIIADFISIILYLNKELYFTAILFIAYTILAFAGYAQWKKSLEAEAV